MKVRILTSSDVGYIFIIKIGLETRATSSLKTTTPRTPLSGALEATRNEERPPRDRVQTRSGVTLLKS